MAEATQAAGKKTNGAAEAAKKAKLGRRTLRTLGRKKRIAKLKTDKEFSKKFFEAKSTRATAKKAAFRKKKKNKK